MVENLHANAPESAKERRARTNRESKAIGDRLYYLRLRLDGYSRKEGKKVTAQQKLSAERRTQYLAEMRALKKRQQVIPGSAPHPKVGYIRYADDYLVILQGHSKADALGVKRQIGELLATHLKLEQSEEKTLINHPKDGATFLGYTLTSSGQRAKKLRLKIPKDAERDLLQKVTKLSRLHSIEAVDYLTKINALTRGWMNYHKYATNPQRVFGRVLRKVFWLTCHYLGRKHKTSIPKILRKYQVTVTTKNGQTRKILRTRVKDRSFDLWLFPPQTVSIYAVRGTAPEIDHRPVIGHSWATGRSLADRIETLEANHYQCQACGTSENLIVHHIGGLRGYKRRRDRIRAAKAKEKMTLCRDCHLRVGHRGNFAPQ